MITELPARLENPDLSKVYPLVEKMLAQLLFIKPGSPADLQRTQDELCETILDALYGEKIRTNIVDNLTEVMKKTIKEIGEEADG
jgi:hypothetical protein